jgi:MFS family permease
MKRENNKIILEHLSAFGALMYGFLVFCGALYFHFYYNTFHINIFRYLDVSEISVSFLHILIPTVIVIGVLVGYFYCIVSFPKLKNKKKVESAVKKVKPLLSMKKIQSIWVFIAFAVCTVFLFISNDRLSTSMTFYHDRDIFGFIFILIPIILTFLKYNLKFVTINTVIIFIMASVYNAIGDVQSTIEGSQKTTWTILTKDNDTIITNKKFYFVGRTNQYVFLYNSIDGTNIDIPVSEIKKISYK